MRSLLWTNAVLALMLLALAAAGHVFAEGKFLAESPPALSQSIGEIQDIEHLRKLALFLVRGNDETVQNTNQIIVSSTEAITALSFGCAIIFLLNSLSIFKHIRTADGRAPKWLRWL